MKVKTFDKMNLQHIRVSITEALEKVAKEYGIKLELGSISYQERSFTGKLNAAVIGQFNSEVSLKEIKYAEDLKKYSQLFGLTGRKHGDKVTVNREQLTLIGVAPNRRKYPIVFKKNDGKLILYTEDALVSAKWEEK